MYGKATPPFLPAVFIPIFPVLEMPRLFCLFATVFLWSVAFAAPAPSPDSQDHAVRIALVGDNITQPSTGFTGIRGAQIPGATAEQQAIANAIVASQATLAQTATIARAELN